MNDERRAYVRAIKSNLCTTLDLIEDAMSYAEITLGEEIESFKSFPEKFKASKTYKNLAENINLLEALQEELENEHDNFCSMIEITKQILSKKK